MKRGLVIGKFYPPHSGHKHLINQALAGCDELDVLICDNEKYCIDAELRKEWIQKIHPTAKVQIIPDIDNDNDSELWAAYTTDFLGYTPDIIFSSEDYGIQYAYCMDAEHHMVDKQRKTVPVSGTKGRNNMFKEWCYVEKPVRADLALRIAVVGAESTGTTPLAQDLAKPYCTPWVPEYGRLYSEALGCFDIDWNDHDFEHIARTQQRMERTLATKSNGLLICDTNATATQLWQERYLGHTSETVAEIAAKDK